MGKPTGFMEFEREAVPYRDPLERLNDYDEINSTPEEGHLQTQGARCMDCGVPFCQSGNGCPIDNLIPEWNHLVYQKRWKEAIDRLHKTNNFPEFTGRVCPAPCEGSCVLGITNPPVTIKNIENTIINRAFDEGWVTAEPPADRTGKKIAVVGSGPAGLAAADQLNKVGHSVTVFERADRIGGLLMYGIPNMKLDKDVVERRINLMRDVGVEFVTCAHVGKKEDFASGHMTQIMEERGCEMQYIDPKDLQKDFDAVLMATGATKPFDPTGRNPGRELNGIHFAMDFLTRNTKSLLDANLEDGEYLTAKDKHVIVIGGGDTGSDCVGTSNRQGAASVTQLEIMPKPPEKEDKALTWPDWPLKLRTSSSHEEGVDRDWAVLTKRVTEENGDVAGLECVRVEWKDGRMQEVEGSTFTLKADLILLAMGFTGPKRRGLLDRAGVDLDGRGNVAADTEWYLTSEANVFSCGDMRRGQSLVVWAIREGRQCARAVDLALMGASELPR